MTGSTITDSGTVRVDAGQTLTLSGTAITGGTVTDNGTIDVTGSSSIAGAALTGGHLTVGTGQTLTLDGSTVTGSAITDSGTVRVDAGQTLNLSGVSLTRRRGRQRRHPWRSQARAA